MAINAQQLEGRAIKGTGQTIFLVTNNQKFPFQSYQSWISYGLSTPTNLNNFTTVSDVDLNSIPTGPGYINTSGRLVADNGQQLGNGKTIPVGSNISANTFAIRPPMPANGNLNRNQYSYYDVQRMASEMARTEVARVAAEKARLKTLGSVFTMLSIEDDVLENQKAILTNGLFSGDAATLSTMFTASLQTTSSKQYYYEAYNKNTALADSEAQFSVAYGHRLGSGSAAESTFVQADSPTRAVYSQYKLLLLDPDDNQFTFKDKVSSDSIYAINFNRARVKEKLDPGNWQLTLGQLSGSTVPNNSHTGSNVKIQTLNPSFISLIDDSGDYENKDSPAGANGGVYNVVSGSLAEGIHNPTAPHYYGLAYPTMGVIILNDNVLNLSCSFNTVTGSNVVGDNAWKLFTSISGAMSTNSTTNAFQARNVETVSSTHYFVRVKNGEYNYTNNPTYVKGKEGEIANATWKLEAPITYITTVGLYNNRQELLAVAKLSQPIQKSFAIETLIKVKLDY